MIEVRELGAGEEAAWDTFLGSHRGGLIYHSIGYRSLISEHLSCATEYLLALEGDEIRGALPIMWSGQPDARVCNSLPFYGSHGSPVASIPEAAATLISAWNERVTDPSTLAATMIGNPFLDGEPPEPVHELTDERISQVTALPESVDEEGVLALVESSARRNARKAERAGIEVDVDATAWADLHEIHRANIEAIGGLAKSRAFFDSVPRHIPEENFDLWVARLDGQVIATLLVLHFNRVSEYFTPATRHEHRSEQPLALILVKAMAAAAARGSRLWNWGGTWTSQDGVYRFKRKWGASEGRYRYFVQLNDRSLLDASPEELRERFPGFYVVPFSAMQPTGGPA